MTSNHFLVKAKNLHPPVAFLDEGEHHHLSRVLRIGPGDRVWLMDAEGNTYLAEVMEVGGEKTRLSLLEKKAAPAGRPRLVLAQALLKSKNMDLVIQKATELGVGIIVPIAAARSVVKLGGKETPKLERWKKIAQEAAKQSRRPDIPTLEAPQPLAAFLGDRNEPRKLILCESGGAPLREVLMRGFGPAGEGNPAVAVLVGPEGGWTRQEEEQAVASGFEAVSLGGRILRSETAAFAVSAAISVFWGV